MKIIIVIVFALLIITGFKIVRMGLKYLVSRFSGISFLEKPLTIIELLIWTIFIFQSLYYLFGEKFYYQYLFIALIIVLTGFISWFFLRDMLAGFFFRIRYTLKTGAQISIASQSGVIKSYGLTSIKIITSDGLLLNIPYSKMINEIIIEKSFRGAPEEHILQLQADLSLGRTKAEELIRLSLLNAPWTNPKEEPVIKFMEENKKGYLFEVKLFSVKEKNIRLIENSLENFSSIHVVTQRV
ncbi:MAG TPA: mechanosensitive ion channel domain-containing protein [Bacteroidales bacterium]|nr:mechanosensitive ion channel domain-containing protein [Bacteroidales bacterium]